MKINRTTIAFSLISGFSFAFWQAQAETQTETKTQSPPQPIIQSPPLSEVAELDADERSTFFNQRLALHCNTCHSSEMIQQQYLTLTQWQAEVQKMVNWGSTLPKDYINLMGEHLSKLYPAEETRKSPSIAPALAIEESSPKDLEPLDERVVLNDSVQALFKTQCANCHGENGQGAELGIRLTERPILLHPEQFESIVTKGRGIMPAFNENVKKGELTAIRRWLMSQSFSFQSE
jgi:mono/diheme cytochrome c family protein